MSHNKIIYVLFLVIAVLFLIIGINYFLLKKQASLPQDSKAIIDPDTNALASVILDTDKEIYGIGENITALILVKNEFDTEKNWKLFAGIKEKSMDGNSAYKLKQEKSIVLSPGETTRQDLIFDLNESSLTPGEYRLELSILERGQEVGLKTAIFQIQ